MRRESTVASLLPVILGLPACCELGGRISGLPLTTLHLPSSPQCAGSVYHSLWWLSSDCLHVTLASVSGFGPSGRACPGADKLTPPVLPLEPSRVSCWTACCVPPTFPQRLSGFLPDGPAWSSLHLECSRLLQDSFGLFSWTLLIGLSC